MVADRPVPGDPEPGQLRRRQDREHLVVGLEERPVLVQQRVRPRPAVAGDAGEQDEIVVPAGDVDRVELDRAKAVEDGHDARRLGGQGPRRGEQVVEREVAPGDVARQLERGGGAAVQRVGSRHAQTRVAADS